MTPRKRKPLERLDRQLRVEDLERELKLKDERIKELKAEVDETRDLVRRMEEHVQDGAEQFERFIQVFGLVLNSDGKWTNSEAIAEARAFHEQYEDLRLRHNRLVDIVNRRVVLQPVGRPIAASEAQQEQIMKHHKAGKSARSIAEELNLSRRTVTTVIDKSAGADRTTAKHRARLGLEPARKDWRVAARTRMPKTATEHFEKGRALLKEAKGRK
jgi:hypothetical protein